ncbi:DUF1638 domain-containing protein [Pontiella sp. NLcol2]|uniref:DUF1638 domain-containing protein n=2 Tax=Pontiella agarivorans TaxID=3038953 RepID=A0ABU5N0L3_9BACT|nr:DUF1638 domain-containing protein [Pontiella agarivorans]
MKLKLISCEIFYREMQFLLKAVPHEIDVQFLQKGLHDIPTAEMLKRLQAEVDNASEEKYDAIIMGYGLCNNGLEGLKARSVPVIIPRAHDCITLFLGSRWRYKKYFNENPGTFFKTTGWIERDYVAEDLKDISIPTQLGMDLTYEQLVEKYGEDNAEFLWEELCDTEKNYSQITFIEMGVEPDDSFEQTAREEAVSKGWKFKKVSGRLDLLRRMLHGDWDSDDFLVISPGSGIVTTHNDTIIRASKDI